MLLDKVPCHLGGGLGPSPVFEGTDGDERVVAGVHDSVANEARRLADERHKAVLGLSHNLLRRAGLDLVAANGDVHGYLLTAPSPRVPACGRPVGGLLSPEARQVGGREVARLYAGSGKRVKGRAALGDADIRLAPSGGRRRPRRPTDDSGQPASYSITSSARASTDCGIVMPR